MPISSASSDREPLLYGRLVLLAVLGFAYALVVVWYGHGWFYVELPFASRTDAAAEKSWKFLSYGKPVLWLMLLGVECALWFVVIGAYAELNEPEAGTLRERLSRWVPRLLGYTAIMFMFFLPVLYSYLFAQHPFTDGSPLLWHGPKILVVAVPAVVAVVCVVARLREVNYSVQELPKYELAERIRNYLGYQKDLRFILGVLGLMLSLNVFATAAQRNALLTYGHWAAKNQQKNEPTSATDTKTEPVYFDMELVFAFAGAYTFLVIAFYAPVYFSLMKAAQAIIREAVPDPPRCELPPGEASMLLLARMDIQGKWATALGLESDWLKSLQAGLVLLSPFFAALVSMLLPSGK